jgi:Methyltransferase domain
MSSPPQLPRDFYTGLVADTYRYLRSAPVDPAPYERFVRRVGEPALELGCGDGDPLLDLVASGLDVEGLDASSDMLDRCRRRAAQRGLDVTLHLAGMEDMDVGRRYRSIYLAGATFNLLVDDATAGAALGRIAAHLTAHGVALVPLTIPTPTPPTVLGEFREHVTEDGATMRVAVVAEERDEARRLQVAHLRYESAHGAEAVDSTERPWILHWHTQPDFHALADAAGLSVVAVLDPDGRPAGPDATTFVFLLTPA